MSYSRLLLTLALLSFGFLLHALVRTGPGMPLFPAHARRPVRVRVRRCPLCGTRLAADQGLIGRPLPDGRFLFTGCSACAEQDGMESGRGR